MSNYAVIRDGVIVNVVVWDGDPQSWTPPDGTTTEPLDAGECVSIGDPWGE